MGCFLEDYKAAIIFVVIRLILSNDDMMVDAQSWGPGFLPKGSDGRGACDRLPSHDILKMSPWSWWGFLKMENQVAMKTTEGKIHSSYHH